MRRIIASEGDGASHPEILRKIIDALKLDKEIVKELNLLDRIAY